MMNQCNRFESCDAPLCPLDKDADKRIRLAGEPRCPFTMENKTKHEKGVHTIMTDNLLKFILKKNQTLLNTRNLKRLQKIMN